MKIATWNINSVRLRLPVLKKFVQRENPDIVCLQETKVQDADFPLEALKSLGFPHIVFSGQKSYNGVAILSKIKMEHAGCMPVVSKSDHKRHICATLPGGIELHNFYVPAGGDIPDAKLNPAYGFKLKFVEQMTAWSRRNKNKKRMIIVGDFNIAPLEHDVWSHKQLLDVVSHTPPEVTRLNALKDSLGWCDAARHFTPESEKLYSWWSYRNQDWEKSDRGRRLDHIWTTPALKGALKACNTLKDMRGWNNPSDHVPVMMLLKV